MAALIDALVLLGLSFAHSVVVTVVWQRTYDDERSLMIADVVFFGGWLAYTSMEIWLAATPGKLATGLRIRQQDCSRADRWRLFLRWETKQYPTICALLFSVGAGSVFYALGGFMNLVVLVGCLYAANDDQLAWHDQWAGTCVCRKSAAAVATTMPPPLPSFR